MTATFSLCDIAGEVVGLVGSAIAKRYRVVPVCIDGFNLTLACDGDFCPSDMDTLRASFRYSLSFRFVSSEEMDEALRQYYPD